MLLRRPRRLLSIRSSPCSKHSVLHHRQIRIPSSPASTNAVSVHREMARPPATEHLVLELDETGTMNSAIFSRRDLLCLLPGLEARDLRSVERSSRQISSVLVRGDCLLVKIDYLKAILRPKSILLFDGEEASIKRFGDQLRSILRTAPYEFVALEAILGHVCQDYDRRLLLLDPIVNKILNSLTKQKDLDDALMRLVPVKKSLINFEYCVKEFRSAVEDMLKSDEDLASMYLTHKLTTGQPRPISEHLEAEMLFENYAKKAEEIHNEISAMRENIKATELLIEMSLDVTRNQLMRLNLQMTMAAAAFGGGSLIAGVFGMNLANGYEMSASAFGWALGGIGVAVGGLYMMYSLLYLKSRSRVQHVSKMATSNSFFDNVNSPEYVDQLWNAMDRAHFRDLMEGTTGRKLNDSDLEAMFSKFDLNVDGVLDRAESHLALGLDLDHSRKRHPHHTGRASAPKTSPKPTLKHDQSTD